MTGCFTSEKNQNLTHLENLILKWHFKPGHTSLYTVQWIGRQGWLGKLGEKMGRNSLNIPKCEDFQYGKQERNKNMEQDKVRIKG